MHVFSFSSLARSSHAVRAQQVVLVAKVVHEPALRWRTGSNPVRGCARVRMGEKVPSMLLFPSLPPLFLLPWDMRPGLRAASRWGRGNGGLALVHKTLAKTLHGHRVLGERVFALSVVYSSRPMRGQPAYSSPTVAYSSPLQ